MNCKHRFNSWTYRSLAIALLVFLAQQTSRGDRDLSSFWIMVDDITPVDMMIIDPEGRCTGFDAVIGDSCADIPAAVYFDEYIGDAEGEGGMGSKQIQINQPAGGEYRLRVTSTVEGTYELGIYGQDILGEAFVRTFDKAQIVPNARHEYTIVFDKSSGPSGFIMGGLAGGGDRTAGIDRLLSYVNLAAPEVLLPPGTEAFGLFIVYDRSILPQTFSASLNGQDVSGLFNPSVTGYETVSIPVKPGENVLVMTIEGDTPEGTDTDTDSLVFLVQ